MRASKLFQARKVSALIVVRGNLPCDTISKQPHCLCLMSEIAKDSVCHELRHNVVSFSACKASDSYSQGWVCNSLVDCVVVSKGGLRKL